MTEQPLPQPEEVYKEYKDAYHTDVYGETKDLAEQKFADAQNYKEENLEELQAEASLEYQKDIEYRNSMQIKIAEAVKNNDFRVARDLMQELEDHVSRDGYERPDRKFATISSKSSKSPGSHRSSKSL